MPIVLSKEELARITRWTDIGREDPEVVRRREYVKYLDETSRKMTKSWPNSLENVNRRNEELRLARIQVAEQANANFYKRYVRKQRERQQRLMASARDIIFKNKDAPKLLLSAVIETCVQKERMEQLKFLNKRRQEAAEQKRREDDEIIRKAREWEELNNNRRRLRFEADKRNQQAVLEQAHEVAERNRIEHETELKMQQLDNLQATQQIEALKDFDEKFKAAEKARILGDMDRAAREGAARRAELAARDRMDDRLIHVLNRSKARVEKKRVETEENIKAAKLKVLEDISRRLESGDSAKAAKEQAILDKAIREKEEREEKRRQKQKKRADDFIQQRVEQRQQWLRDQDQKEKDAATRLQWECMNRFKNLEIYEDFKEKLREEKERKIKEYREDMLRLWKEREDREAAERAETRYFYGELAEKKLRAADNKLLAHARGLVEEARAHGRPEGPLIKAIDMYCRLNRLYPMPELPRSMQEHFEPYAPTDHSEPDPGYVDTERAPPTAGPSPTARGDARNGLQDPPTQEKPSTSKRNDDETVKKEKTKDDYKRVGRANGLQRRNETELSLPAISVVPCKTQTCSCVLKQ